VLFFAASAQRIRRLRQRSAKFPDPPQPSRHAAAPLVSATSLAGGLGMAVKKTARWFLRRAASPSSNLQLPTRR
jgi:hypothetical protein